MGDEYVYPDVPNKKPDPRPIPSQAEVMKRTVERSQDGAYELAGGGNVIYNISQKNLNIDSTVVESAKKNFFETHQKTIASAALIMIILGISAVVGVKFGLFATSTTSKDIGK